MIYFMFILFVLMGAVPVAYFVAGREDYIGGFADDILSIGSEDN